MDRSIIKHSFCEYRRFDLGDILWMLAVLSCEETEQRPATLSGTLKTNRAVHCNILGFASFKLPETQNNHLEFTLRSLDRHTYSLRCI